MTPSRLNLSAFEIRFCISWRICGASALIVGSSPTVTRASDAAHEIVEVLEHVARDLAEIDRLERPRLHRHPREDEQILDQPLHPLGRGVGALQIVEAAIGQRLGVDLADALGERAHLAQRLLEVVRRDRRELLELGVGARELAGAALELGV